MYRKVHLRLTVLCAGITTAILIIMSLSYLYVSEKGLYTNQNNSFKNDINTIATNLEQQSVITMEWLSKMESQGNYIFFVLDNGVPFLYNQLTESTDETRHLLLNESLDAYSNIFSVSQSELFNYNSYHLEFQFYSPSTTRDYYGSVINLQRNTSLLEVVVLFSLDALEHQILEQRIRFLIIDLTAILLLTIFSFIFTGKLLRPILENQQKQAAFVAFASHELRTPLAVILSSAECCMDADSANQAKFLKTIKKEGLLMSALINDMLTLSSSDNHRFPIAKKPVELDTLLINTYEAFEPLAKEKSHTLSIKLPNYTLPPCICDPDRIGQVISILLHNAISYTPEQGKIDLSLSYQKGSFAISVSDNGIGISNEDKKKIFDRFYRAEKSRSTKGHFGLGLSIAYEIVNAHRGCISVADAEKGGCIFTVTLPEQ